MEKVRPKSEPCTSAETAEPVASKYEAFCADIKSRGLLRELPQSPASPDPIDFSHNDYLGLSKHPSVIDAAKTAVEQFGTGSRAARLLAGSLDFVAELESLIARDKGTESALIFCSGFQANQSVLTALLDSTVLGNPPRVFSDRLNHASLHHGCMASHTRQHRYRHLDLDHLESLLTKHADCPRPKFILTETLFGMDGDHVDVDSISKLANRFGAFLYLDEAHATGMLGKQFYGLSNDASSPADLVMGTLGKALGSSGAFVACSKKLKSYLVNRCAGFIYSTAPNPASIAAAKAAWELIPQLDAERAMIKQHRETIRSAAASGNWDLPVCQSHILPLIVGETERVTQIGDALMNEGIRVSSIRPPTVPEGTARIRLALSSTHSPEQVQKLVQLLGNFLDQPS